MIRRAFVRALSGAILTTLLGVRPWRLEGSESAIGDVSVGVGTGDVTDVPPLKGWVLEVLGADGKWREHARGEGDIVTLDRPLPEPETLDQSYPNIRSYGVWLPDRSEP